MAQRKPMSIIVGTFNQRLRKHLTSKIGVKRNLFERTQFRMSKLAQKKQPLRIGIQIFFLIINVKENPFGGCEKLPPENYT